MNRREKAQDAPENEAEGERRLLTARTSVVTAGTLLSRGLGLVRDVVLAAAMSRATTDVFFVAFTIPNALRQLLAEGTVQSAVIPVLSEVRQHDGEDAARFFHAALRGIWLLALVIVTALGIGFAPQLAELFAPGFHDTGQFERLVVVTRWVFAFLMFMGAAALGMGALTTHRRFGAVAFSPAMVNVALIIAALSAPALLHRFGLDPAVALAIGALAGGALQVAAQWPSLRRLGYFTWPRIDLQLPAVREVGRRLRPLLVGMLVYFVNIAMARRLLSTHGEGAQSYFTWAFRLCAIPQGLFIIALATASLPALSALAARGDRDELGHSYAYGMRLAMFVAMPAAALLAGLAGPLVTAFFVRGAFDHGAAHETATAVIALALGIPAVAAIRQLTIVFNANGDTRTPVIGSGVHLVVFVLTSMFLAHSLGHVAICAGYTVANTAQALFLAVMLRGSLPTLHLLDIANSAGRALLASCVALGPAVLAAHWLTPGASAGGVLRVVPAAVAAPMFFVVFVWVCGRVGSRELAAIEALVREKIGGG